MSVTYNSLISQISATLDRTDDSTIEQIPNFISLAEQTACRLSKTIGFEQYVTGFFGESPGVPGDMSVMAKPARWRRTISFNFGTGTDNNARTPLLLRSYEYLRQYWPDPTQTAPPQYYADYGYFNFLIAPTPDAQYPFELAYLELPPPISPTNQTNWLTNYAPDVLFYGALIEAIPYLKDDERIPVWQSKYDKAMASLNQQDDWRKVDRSNNRDAD